MSTSVHAAERVQLPSGEGRLAQRLIDVLGGRCSTELGIDVDAGEAEVERWFPAATLLGTRIASSVASGPAGCPSEGGLVRLTLTHHNHMDECPGDGSCTVLAYEPSTREPR